jgi:uncharacterized protein (TIGR02246 family)
MRILFLLLISCSIANNLFCQQQSAYNSKDLAALNQLPVKWQHYWNTHDMDSMGTMLSDDIDFINVAGVWMKGKIAAVKDHKEKHLGVRFKTSVWQTDSVAVKYVKPDIAIMHIGWGISGDFENETTPRPPRHGIFTWIVNKKNSRWFLIAVQNTNIKDVAVKPEK